jgi:hypothetical protein
MAFRGWIGDFGASIGALLVAVAPAHVVHSRFQTVDVSATFWAVACVYFSLRLLALAENAPPGKLKFLTNPTALATVAGVCAGLSAGTKYTSGLAILSLVAVLALRRGRNAWIGLAAGFAGFLVAFFVSTPGALLDSSAFWRDLSYEMQHTATGHGLVFAGAPIGFIAHIGNLLCGIGVVLTVLGLVGLAAGAWRKHRWIWVLLAFAIPYYLVIGRAQVAFIRYTFPLYPAFAGGFAYLMGRAHEKRGRFMWLAMLGIVGLGGLDPGGLRMAGVLTADMMGEDPRDAAARYLKERCGNNPDSVVGLVSDPWYYTPPLYLDSALGPAGAAYLIAHLGEAYREQIGTPQWKTFPEAMIGVRDLLMSNASRPRVELLIPYDPNKRDLGWDLVRLNNSKPDYVVVSSFETEERLRPAGSPDLDAVQRAYVDQAVRFAKELPKTYARDAVFGGTAPPVHDLEYICPTIEVWKRTGR